jgi:hypothetical protein
VGCRQVGDSGPRLDTAQKLKTDNGHEGSSPKKDGYFRRVYAKIIRPAVEYN